jgi:hypothetical protein
MLPSLRDRQQHCSKIDANQCKPLTTTQGLDADSLPAARSHPSNTEGKLNNLPSAQII